MTTLYVRDRAHFREATTRGNPWTPAVTDGLSELAKDAIPGTFHVRNLLVGSDSDLRIKSRGFELAGFSRGARVSVRVFKKRLVIDVVQELFMSVPHHFRASTLQISLP